MLFDHRTRMAPWVARVLTISNAAVFLPAFLLLSVETTAVQQWPNAFDRPDPTDENVTTGPAVGERIPDFTAPDQHGRITGLKDICGPKGAILLFFRSADW